MWKWILGILLVLVVVIAGTCFAGFRKVVGGGDTAVVTLPVGLERAFSMLSDADSMQAWMQAGSHVSPLGRGVFKVGDTLQIANGRTGADSLTEERPQLWVVSELTAPTLLVLDAIGFNSVGAPYVMFSRRDSLVAVGDSTAVHSTFVMGGMMTVNGAPADTLDHKVPDLVQKIALGSMRLAGEAQLKALKRHLTKP